MNSKHPSAAPFPKPGSSRASGFFRTPGGKPSRPALAGWVFASLFLGGVLLFGGLWKMFAGQYQLERGRRALERVQGVQALRRELRQVLEAGRQGGKLERKILGFQERLLWSPDGTILPFEKGARREEWEEDSLLLGLSAYLDGLREEQRGEFEAALGRYRLALGKKRKVPLQKSARRRLELGILRASLRAGRREEAKRAWAALAKEKLSPLEAFRAARLRLEMVKALGPETRPAQEAKARRTLKARLEALRPSLSLLDFYSLQKVCGFTSGPQGALKLYRFLAAHRSAWMQDPQACLVWDQAQGGAALLLLGPGEGGNEMGVPLRRIRVLGRREAFLEAWRRTSLPERYDWEAVPGQEAGSKEAEVSVEKRSQEPLLELASIGLHIRLKDLEPLAASFWEAPRGRLLFLLFLLMQGGLGIGLWATLRGLARERRLVRMRTDFVSSVSHELKTPLTSIRLYSDLLRREGSDPQKHLEYSQRIQEEAKKLSFLVTNVLDAARMEAGRSYREERVDLVELTRTCAREFEARIRQKGASLQLLFEKWEDGPPPRESGAWVRGDPEALARLLSNLVDNALKHGGPKIQIRLRSLPQAFELRVQDDGPGIPKSERERLFRPFERGGAHGPNQAPGSGLGLAIVREIVEAHAGVSVHIEDPPQGGLSLVLHFPKAPEQET